MLQRHKIRGDQTHWLSRCCWAFENRLANNQHHDEKTLSSTLNANTNTDERVMKKDKKRQKQKCTCKKFDLSCVCEWIKGLLTTWNDMSQTPDSWPKCNSCRCQRCCCHHCHCLMAKTALLVVNKEHCYSIEHRLWTAEIAFCLLLYFEQCTTQNLQLSATEDNVSLNELDRIAQWLPKFQSLWWKIKTFKREKWRWIWSINTLFFCN